MAPQSEHTSSPEESEEIKADELKQITDRKIELNVLEIYETLKNFDHSTIIWRNVFSFLIMHILALRGFQLFITVQYKWQTFVIFVAYCLMTTIGTTMGAHRLWAHRGYKATFPLRLILAIFQTVAWQRDIYDWVRDHRVHHKFSETDADPHNARRGLFFSHMGWLLCQKHPDVRAKGKKVDFSDILADPIVVYQRKYYVVLSVMLNIIIPCFVPWYYWGESVKTAFFVVVMFRYVSSLHCTWSVNSFAHWVGNRPYDGYIYPAQNKWVSLFSGGEGWHNYHHAFPYDYRAAELGGISKLNIIATLIDICAFFGLAYDLRIPTDQSIQRKANNNGDGSFQGLAVSN